MATNQTRIQKIISAIQDCDRFIAKEAPRSADLRPASVAKTLEHAKAHRAKLTALLASMELCEAYFTSPTFRKGLEDHVAKLNGVGA